MNKSVCSAVSAAGAGICARISLLVLLSAVDAAASTVLYPAPAGASLSADYTVKVNGQTISVYRGLRQGLNYSFAYFDFSGTVNVEVTIASPWMRPERVRREKWRKPGW